MNGGARGVLATVCTVACLALTACGGEPPPKAAEPVQPESHEVKPALKMRSELGIVDPDAVKRSFARLEDRFMSCQKRGLERVDVLSGAVKFFLRIGEDGRLKWAHLEETELGDRDTEKCLIDVVMSASWPKPDSGDAEARYSMELPLQATRPANDWSADRITSTLGKHARAIDKCKAGASASFRATMYVGPGGKVLAAGVAMSSKDGEDKADCLAKVLAGLRGLPSPGSWPAKVSFGL